MEALFPLAFLFLLLLVVNACFNLFCGLCVVFVCGNQAITKLKQALPTGVTAQIEDFEGRRRPVTPEELEARRREDEEINRMVERWTLM